MPRSDLRQREFHPLKVLHHFDRIRALAEDRDVAPVTVEIDPVAYCNHACAWCVDPRHHAAQMSEQTFELLVKELRTFAVTGFRVEGIVFKGGGEPTLHPNFGAMVDHAAASGFAIGIVTNGSRLTRWAPVLAERASYVRISIDGPTPESHAAVHHSRDFADVVHGVEQLVGARATARHPVIGLTFAMDAATIDLADEALHLGERLGVDYVLLRPPFFEEVGRQATMSIEQAREVRRRLRELARSYRGMLNVMVGDWIGDAEQRASGLANEGDRDGEVRRAELGASGRRDLHLAAELPIEHRTGRCLASPILAVVTADGNLYGCCNLRALPQWSFGRIDYAAGIGFTQLWQGSQRQEVLQRMHRTDCIVHCTHPLSRYNEIIEVLRDNEHPHSQFV
jgi:MoaA/NifB/PqqE/SkfB family radical SAM enzyme